MTEWQRPDFGTVTPHLMVEGADELVEFLLDAFDAEVLTRRDRPDGTMLHAEVCIGDSMLIVSEATDEFGPIPAALHLYVEDCDDAFAASLEAGAAISTEPTTDRHSAERFAVLIAMGRSRPESMSGCAAVTLAKIMSASPEATPTTPCDTPLYGTWMVLIFAREFMSSAARWAELPMPDVA